MSFENFDQNMVFLTTRPFHCSEFLYIRFIPVFFFHFYIHFHSGK